MADLTLESVFWDKDANFVVVVQDGPRIEMYGPFYNDFVARTWAGDMKFASFTVRAMIPPTQPPHRLKPEDRCGAAVVEFYTETPCHLAKDHGGRHRALKPAGKRR